MMVDEASDLEGARDAARGAAPRHSRRLSDKILIAFHHACDQADYEVAEQLLAHPRDDADAPPGLAGHQPPPQHGKPGRGA